MADTKISALTELAASAIALDDELAMVDKSTATTKRATYASLTNGSLGVNTVGATGATETIPLSQVHRFTMDQSCTFTFPTPTLASHTFVLYLAGAFTPTFPASVDWAGAAAPTYATPSIYLFHTSDTGTTWFGALFGGAGGFG